MNKSIRKITTLLVAIVMVFSISVTSLAHKMMIVPVEDGKIQVNYDAGNAATRAEIKVYDKDGKILSEGKVDEEGYYEYEAGASYLEADDGMGHKDKWTIGEEAASTGGSKLPKIAAVVVVLGLVGFFFSKKKK